MSCRPLLAAAAIAVLAGGAVAQTSITKPPDFGPWWWPINPNSGTYVYASDFILDSADTSVTSLGTWLNQLDGSSSSGRFEIWGHNDAGGPDPNNVLVSTGTVTPNTVIGSLDYHEFPASGADLVSGDRYWFVITVVGESGDASWQTGGHTQNSVYNDNGTFWYSNDVNGVNFDGRGLTPQIAFQVNLTQGQACAADLDDDGDADVNDFFLFLDLFDSQDPRADIDDDGDWDVNDFFMYLDLFARGC